MAVLGAGRLRPERALELQRREVQDSSARGSKSGTLMGEWYRYMMIYVDIPIVDGRDMG